MASPASLKLAKPFCTVPHARGLCDSFDQSEDGAPGPPGAALEFRGGLTLAGLYRRVRSGREWGTRPARRRRYEATNRLDALGPDPLRPRSPPVETGGAAGRRGD